MTNMDTRTALISGISGQDGAYLAQMSTFGNVDSDPVLMRPSDVAVSRADPRLAA